MTPKPLLLTVAPSHSRLLAAPAAISLNSISDFAEALAGQGDATSMSVQIPGMLGTVIKGSFSLPFLYPAHMEACFWDRLSRANITVPDMNA